MSWISDRRFLRPPDRSPETAVFDEPAPARLRSRFHRAEPREQLPPPLGGVTAAGASEAPEPRQRPDGGVRASADAVRHLEELQVVILKLSGLRCSLHAPEDGPPFLSVCRAEAVRTRQAIWCEPPAADRAAATPAEGAVTCCSPASADTSCGFAWGLGPIGPVHELFEAAIVIINAMTAPDGPARGG